MRNHNVPVLIFVILIIFAVVILLMFKTRKITNDAARSQALQSTSELTDALNELDYNIYWIGDPPPFTEGISGHIILLDAGSANEDTLPVAQGVSGFTETSPEGEVLNHIEKRDYASYMMIVANSDENLPDDLWDVIRNCCVDNKVPLLVIGRENVLSFRRYMIMVEKDLEEGENILFEAGREACENPIDPALVTLEDREYANALLELFGNVFSDPPEVRITAAAFEDFNVQGQSGIFEEHIIDGEEAQEEAAEEEEESLRETEDAA